jgi:hypothetical protein
MCLIDHFSFSPIAFHNGYFECSSLAPGVEDIIVYVVVHGFCLQLLCLFLVNFLKEVIFVVNRVLAVEVADASECSICFTSSHCPQTIHVVEHSSSLLFDVACGRHG